MALDITQSEEAFNRSIKKYFVDELHTGEGILIEFDTVYRIPDGVNEWLVFHFDGLHYQGNLATGRVSVYMFSQKDDEGVKLAKLRDTLMDKVLPGTDSDGIKRIDLVDDLFAKVKGMVVTIGNESDREVGEDGVKYKYVNLYFKYGTL